MRLDVLAARLREGVPLLVVRLPELERVAWRRGLRAARALERRASAAFERAVASVLRADDLTAHDPGSDVFLAALLAPTREGGETSAVDARAALLRIATAVEAATGRETLTGWTAFADTDGIHDAVERALRQGAQERERYAFFSALGHELRTPLSSIRGYLETLLDDDVDEATRRRFVEIAHGESLRMSRLVDGMFEISLLDLHAAFPVRAHARLDAVLDVVRDACSAAAAARGVRLTFASCDVAIAMEADRLALVLINVVENAVKHGRAGGSVRVLVVPDQRTVDVLIDDDGPGIAAHDRERVFAFGERGASAAPGTGIGLALARLMLERVGGRIAADASPLGGARFTLTLPSAVR